MLEPGGGAAEDEVDAAFDPAVGVVLHTIACVGEERVLVGG